MSKKKVNENEEIQEELIKKISINYNDYDFLTYVNHYIDKWNENEKKNNTIDRIITAVCEKYDIDRKQLIKSNSNLDYYVRGAIFYVIKNKFNLSYNELAVHFNRTKSYVFKILNDINGLLNMSNNSYNSLLKETIELAEKEYQKEYGKVE